MPWTPEQHRAFLERRARESVLAPGLPGDDRRDRLESPSKPSDFLGYVPPAIEDAVKSEKELHRLISLECTRRGWVAFHGSMAHKSKRTPGEPDFTIIADHGRVFFVECKKPGEKPTAEQADIIAQAAPLGITIHVVDSFQGFLAIVGPEECGYL